MKIENALSRSIDEVPDDFVLKSFLKINKSEVSAMLLTEYNEAEVMGLFREDGKREGCDKHLMEQICKKLAKGKDIEMIADEVEEEVATIAPIVEIAQKYAPDYNVDAIYDEFYSKIR